jgi:crossover junction endodeoxyribonuclease RuvC
MNFIGIDPGKSGAIAIIREDGTVDTAVFSEEAYRLLIKQYKDETFAVVEQVGFVPKGVKFSSISMFNFGANFGFIQGLLYAYGVPYQTVRPNVWKKHFNLSKDKELSIQCAKRLFPNASLYRTDRCTIAHDGIAEALLMAEYARRLHNGLIK